MKAEKTGSVNHSEGEIELFTLTNRMGASVTLCNIGAGIVSIRVPDFDGRVGEVVLGYMNPADYFGDGPCMGKTPGRFANRIGGARFSLGGKEFPLSRNNGANHLHGGENGFADRLWNATAEGDKVVFTLRSPDGDQGYPGNMDIRVEYSWNDDNELNIGLSAVSDQDTVVNLTNHTYFNLGGESSGTVLGHRLKLYASRWLEADEGLVPTGKILSVEGTPMDFRRPKKMGKDIRDVFSALINGKGYDSCWAVDEWKEGKLQAVAELTEELSGRRLEVFSTQPGVQVYTGNWLSGSRAGKTGRSYNDHDGVAIECQGFPDAPNQRDFPSAILYGREKYEQTIIYRFSAGIQEQ